MIKVEQHRIKAHRQFLEASTDNYRLCLQDSLRSKLKSELDITPITTDWKAVEAVLSYMYTGQIFISGRNLRSVLKISSVLLINKVRECCINYVDRTLSLDNCLDYYRLAVEHNIPALIETIKVTVQSKYQDPLF